MYKAEQHMIAFTLSFTVVIVGLYLFMAGQYMYTQQAQSIAAREISVE
jgi:hypothetical protein